MTKESSIDFILLDIMMPHMDGWDFCREVRRFSEIPIIILTAKEGTLNKVKGLKLFIIFLFSKQVTQPLIRIKRMSQQIAKGNYRVQLPVKGKDEITDLTIAINSMSKELLRYETTRNEFLSNISHELRTPLMYIKGYADLLNQDRIQDHEERKNYLTYISEETLRVQHLVKDLFDLTKYKDQKIHLDKEKINLLTLRVWRGKEPFFKSISREHKN